MTQQWTAEHKAAFRTYNDRGNDPPAAIWIASTTTLVYGGEVSFEGLIGGVYGSPANPVRLVQVATTSDEPWINRAATQANRGAHVVDIWFRLWLPDAKAARRHQPTVLTVLSNHPSCEAFVGNGWLALSRHETADGLIALLRDELRNAYDRHMRLPPQYVMTDDELFQSCTAMVERDNARLVHATRR